MEFAGKDDGPDDGDGIESIRQRHQRRVEQRRHAANHLEPDERRKHKNVQTREQIEFHMLQAPFASAASAGKPRNSRTRAFTISPSRVSNVSR